MPLELIPETSPQDMPAIYTVNYLSFANEPVILALSPSGLDPSCLDHSSAGFSAGLGFSDPGTASAKVIDTETRAIVAFVVLKSYEASPWINSADAAADIRFPYISDSDGTRSWVEWVFNTKARQRGDIPALRAAGPWMDLIALGTTPERQREGAATLLLRWACERADAAGAKMVVKASEMPMRIGLYEKFGFQKVDEQTYVDEERFPGRSPLTLVTMVRE